MRTYGPTRIATGRSRAGSGTKHTNLTEEHGSLTRREVDPQTKSAHAFQNIENEPCPEL